MNRNNRTKGATTGKRAGSSPGFKLLWRDARSGELNLLIASLILAVATVTCINLFTDRIKASISAQASTLLAADAQVRSGQPIPDDWRTQAASQGLSISDIISFQAMAIADANMQLTSVKAVDEAYPLRGTLSIADRPYGNETVVDQGPPPGEIWLSSRLFAALNVAVGDYLNIGSAQFRISSALLREPDNSGSFFGAGARVMINAEDVPRTEAIQPGSRVNYRWLLADKPTEIAQFHQWVEPRLGEHYRWIDPSENNDGVGEAIKRSERFLLLAGSLGVVLAGAALALASRRYATRQKSAVALLKTLGMPPGQVLRLYIYNILLLGLVTTAVGLAVGWLLHNVILILMGNLLPANLAPAGYAAYVSGAGIGLLVLLAFAAPPLLALRDVPPISVLRSTPSELSALWHGVPGILAVIALIWAYSQNFTLTLFITVGGILAMAGVALFAHVLVRLCARIAKRLRRGLRLGFANLFRHRRYNSVQIMLFSVLLMLLFVLYTLRTSMLEDWQAQLPDNAPNHFAFNIFSSEKGDIQALFAEHNVQTSPFYPMVRGRMTEVNGEHAKERARRLGSEPRDDRELNLTWSQELGKDNRIVAGIWWGNGASDTSTGSAGESPDSTDIKVSFEQSYAEMYRVDVGDKITVSLAGTEREATVTSLRSVQWDSMQPNFYIIFDRPLVDDSAVNWLTSFYLPPEKKEFVNVLGREYPTVSLIELDQMIQQIQNMIQQVSRAVEFILLLIVGAGILVLVASVQATLDIRMHESGLLRALGAPRQLVFSSLLIEFSVMGLLAGLMGALGAEVTLYFLQTKAFNMTFSPHWEVWLFGPLLGIFLVGIVGLASSGSVVRVPPMAVLRKA
jgi:putative ABC transport system permease protein